MRHIAVLLDRRAGGGFQRSVTTKFFWVVLRNNDVSERAPIPRVRLYLYYHLTSHRTTVPPL
jgi:hypothetical protein